MNSKNVVIGNYYRHKDTPNYAWAKVLEVLQPHSGVNTHGYLIPLLLMGYWKGVEGW